jgi:two-component system sensor histidine kinase RpfC
MIMRLATPAKTVQLAAQTSGAAGASLIDESILDDLALMGGGQAFVQELIESFNQDSKRSLGEVERALLKQDYSLWHDQLHMLKGGASDVGAHHLASICADAERIKPFEMGTLVAREKLVAVRSALGEAQTLLAQYNEKKLKAGHG